MILEGGRVREAFAVVYIVCMRKPTAPQPPKHIHKKYTRDPPPNPAPHFSGLPQSTFSAA